MTTSQTHMLSKPENGKRILPETLAYMRARAKRRAYDLVIKAFKESGLSKAEVARRLGKGNDRVSRMLGGPGNWTIATVSDLLFAINAGEPKWEISFPLDRARRNDTKPEWLGKDLVSEAISGAYANSPANVPSTKFAKPMVAQNTSNEPPTYFRQMHAPSQTQ